MTADPLQPSDSSRADPIVARAALARFLQLGLRRPEAVAVEELGRALATGVVVRAAEQFDDDREGLLSAARALTGRPAPRTEELQSAHARIFGHTLRGKVCPYECEYGTAGLFQQAHELADLTGFYCAFGLASATQPRERPDHVACELEFLEFLSRKQLWSLEHADVEMAEVSDAAVRRLLRHHLGRFGRAFAHDLASCDPEGFYGALGRLLDSFVAAECRRHGLACGPYRLQLRPEVAETVPSACGATDGLVQIGGAAAAPGQD